MKHRGFSYYGLFIWCLATAFFFYEYFLRAFVASISFTLMHDLHLTTEQFALMGSAYYIPYAAMQIPVGILVDRYGVRFLLTLACGLCALAGLWFGVAQGISTVFIARLIMGFASSFAFVSLLVISSNWFSKKHFGFLSGLTQLLGSVGPLLAGAPFVLFVQVLGSWRMALGIVGFAGIVLTILIGIFVRNKPKGQETKILFLDPHQSLIKKLRDIITEVQIWTIGFYTSMAYTPIILFGAFWGPSFLRTKGIDHAQSALVSSMVWLGLALGSPICGKLSDRFKRRKPFLFLSCLIGLIGACVVLYAPFSNEIVLSFFFFCIGLGGSGQSLAFPTIAENVSAKYKGAVIGFNNTACMITGIFVPTMVGSIVHSVSKLQTGGSELTQEGFVYGLSVTPLMFVLALVITVLGIKETFCRQQEVVVVSFKN